MNEVFISGKITALIPSYDQYNPHYSFELTSAQQDNNDYINFLTITINTWNSLAEWAVKNLHINDQVLVKGSLIQAPGKSNQLGIEIAATRIVIV